MLREKERREEAKWIQDKEDLLRAKAYQEQVKWEWQLEEQRIEEEFKQ